MTFLPTFHFSTAEWILIIVAALIVGLAKSGLSGFGILVIPMMASTFGGKESTAILLPILIVGDIFAVCYYHRHADWSSIRKLLPWTVIGLTLGTLIGNYINSNQFKMLIGSIVLICLFILLYIEKKGERLNLYKNTTVSIISGISAGFVTMTSNAAGPVFSIYLLSSGFKKNGFIGTSAWFFLILNLAKVPLQVFVWKNLTLNMALTALIMLPIIAAGLLAGTRIVKMLNDRFFRYVIIAMIAIAAIRLFL